MGVQKDGGVRNKSGEDPYIDVVVVKHPLLNPIT
jgi:hypothetical protein